VLERTESEAQAIEPVHPPEPVAPSETRWARARRWARLHGVFLLLLLAGVVLRALAMVAYVPSLPLRSGDAYQYLSRAVSMSVEQSYHPFLYSVLLKPFTFGSLAWLAAVQHLAGIATGILIYLALTRFGLSRWLAALGAAPILLDGYQIALEHQPLTEPFFELLGVAGLVLAAWSTQPRLATVSAGGFLLGLSVLIRFAGFALLPAAVVFLLTRRVGWTRLAALVASFLIPLLGYAVWFQTQTGTFGLTNRNGFYLYGRVADFASCRDVEVPARERVFCPENLKHKPGRGLFNAGLPASIRQDPTYNHLAESFARRMIVAKPGSFTLAVVSDMGKFFLPAPSEESDRWLVARDLTARDQRRVPNGIEAHFRLRPRPAAALRAWQQVVWLHGPLLAVLLLLGLAGAIVAWSRTRRRYGPESLLFTAAAFGLLLFPTIFAVYHFRYYVPAIPFAGAAGAIGAATLLEWRRGRQHRRQAG
jgi:hypothetical protein